MANCSCCGKNMAEKEREQIGGNYPETAPFKGLPVSRICLNDLFYRFGHRSGVAVLAKKIKARLLPNTTDLLSSWIRGNDY